MKPFLILLFLFNISFSSYAQLDSITHINGLGCGGVAGQSINISIDQVPGATYYCWSNVDTIFSHLLFNGQTGIYCATSYSVTVTVAVPDSFNYVCVTAYNANDTSNTFCDTIYGFAAPLSFSPSNDSIVIPNSSGVYSLLPFSGYGCPSNYYTWTITGDAAFDNLNDTLGTGSDTVTINFGPGFITGQLCVYGQTPFNFQGTPICMTINVPVGINEVTGNVEIYNDQSGFVYINLNNETLAYSHLEIFDLNGKKVNTTPLATDSGVNHVSINTAAFSKGMYIVRIQGRNTPFTGKFIIY